MALVTDVIAPLRGCHRRVVMLDHAEWRTTSYQVLTSLGVRAGTIAPEEELAARIDAEEPVRARERAVRLLAYRERSAAQLRGRLSGDGYPDGVTDAVIADLESSGLVDDERFAGALARLLTEVRGIGRSRALRELAAKGVDPDLALAALDESLPLESEREAALRLGRALAARPGATIDRIATRLARKGYAVPVALGAAREALAASLESRADRDEGLSDDDWADLREPAD